MIGKNEKGGFNTAPTAAYPEGMCEFIAGIIFVDWVDSLDRDSPYGRGRPLESRAPTRSRPTLTPRARSSETAKGSQRKACAWDSPLTDPPGSVKGIITESMIEQESVRVDEIGIGRPIQDELEMLDFAPKEIAIPEEANSEEERELKGVKRPRKGAGWWGHGPTRLPLLQRHG